MRRLVPLLVAAAVVGCSGRDGADAGGTPNGGDGGAALDGGPADGGDEAGADAGLDGGPPDAGADAGSFDAGTDGGGDAGRPDAGADAGTLDAGPFDAGPPYVWDGGLQPIGGPCGLPAHCQAGLTLCLPPVGSAYEPGGYSQGYCSRVCDPRVGCGPGTVCIAEGYLIAGGIADYPPRCFEACTVSRTCRPGYVCGPLQYCTPHCGNPTALCQVSSSCEQASGVCR